MELQVHKVQQMVSGGSHVTIYEAEVELVPSGVEVEILSVYPNDLPGDVEMVNMVREAIRQGAERVLQPRGQGAIIRVKRVVVHPVDCKPGRFERHTTEELAHVLARSDSESQTT